MIHSVHGITKKPLFWLLFLAISGGGIWFSFRYFSKAFPILDVHISMDRQQALEKAKQVAHKFNVGPTNYHQAASFDVDSETKNFIELEGGGLPALKKILKGKEYSPYTWSVRHFKESEVNEAIIYFTPEGTLYGFVEKIGDATPGASLTSAQAQALATAHAIDHWHVNFAHYTLAESSQEVKQNGRIDHTFVYERTDKKIDHAPYRLTIIVTGDKVTQVLPSIKVPEAFKRRYQEMRSANSFIAFGALVAIILLYVFGGFIALFLLLRSGWLLWKMPLIIAGILGIFEGLVLINQLPLIWRAYPTALSWKSFIGQIIVQVVLTILGYTVIGTLIIMLAESLTRKAFPHHIRLWKVWSKTAGHSRQIIGRTLGGYLMLGFYFAFAIGLYYLTMRYLGWWSPAEELYNPNILASYIPWLSPIVLSLSAGLLEECLFRAVPLSCAALLGNRFGKKSWWIAGAFLLQAIIFGAAHASYPAQPAYARLVELIIPSFIFAATYLLFGLLPSVISHFIYDVVWFALPIFVSQAPTIWIDKSFIIFFSSIPLLVVLYRYLQARKITNVPSNYYNDAWNPPPISHKEIPEAPISKKSQEFTKTTFFTLIALSCIGVGLWLFFTPLRHDGLAVTSTRQQAIAMVQQKVNEPHAHWQPLATVIDALPEKMIEDKMQHRFAWQALGKEAYEKLLRQYYLKPYTWLVRLVHFEGDVAQRAEEHRCFLRSKDTFIECNHILPEDTALPSLSIQQAREKAHTVLKEHYGLDVTKVTEISAVPKKHSHRTDWTFTFKVPTTIDLKEGEQRIVITCSGNGITDHYRTLFVPETWKRAYEEQTAFERIIIMIAAFPAILLLIFALATILYLCNYHLFSWSYFLLFFSILCIKSLIQAYNIWPTASTLFTTTKPFYHQLWQTILFWLIAMLSKASIAGLLASAIQSIRFRCSQYNDGFLSSLLRGCCIGTFTAGIYAIFQSTQTKALWPDFTAAGAYIPSLSATLLNFTEYLDSTLYLFVIILALDYYTQGWHQRKPLFAGLCILFSLAIFIARLESHPLFTCIIMGLITGIASYLLYVHVIRFDKKMIPGIVASFMSFQLLQQVFFNAYPGALVGNILAIILIMSFAAVWTKMLQPTKA